MRFVLIDGQMTETNGYSFAVSDSLVRIKSNSISSLSVITNNLKNTIKYIKNEWFGSGNLLREGVFWTAFMSYIFPWFLDIAKVYCAIMVAKAFLEERGGRGEGRTGFQSLVHYGKWFIIFSLIPWGVELISQIGEHMRVDLMKKGLQVGG